jgi:hypothetical protein
MRRLLISKKFIRQPNVAADSFSVWRLKATPTKRSGNSASAIKQRILWQLIALAD